MTIRRILWISALLFGVCPGGSALADVPRGKIKFSGRSHDFGKVYRGQKLTHRFSFVNAGKGPLTMQGVHAACGCTAVEAEEGKVYRPGEEGAVVVTLDTTDFVGPLTKAVTVMTNEKVLPDRTLTLRAVVLSEVEASPPMVDFAEVRPGEAKPKMVQVLPIGGFKLKVSGVEFNRSVLDVKMEKAPKGQILEIGLKPTLTPGFLRETVIVKTNGRHMPELKIPVRAEVKGPIDFSPAYLEFGAVSAGDKSRRSITLKADKQIQIASTRTELIINGRKVDDPEKFVRIETLPHEKQRKLVAVELTNVAKSIGSVHGKLIFETNDKRQKELAVDFYAFFR